MLAPRTPALSAVPPLPRIRAVPPVPGSVHPAGPREIAAVLRFFGEPCTYGLRLISLMQGEPWRPAGQRFGRLVVPGSIVLFAQPAPPWLIPGALRPTEHESLERAGAVVETVGGGAQTLISWPGETLRDFMLFDVLMHEVGHHMVQQYTGKRRTRVQRTRDHEAWAARFAARCRAEFMGQPGP